MQHAIYRSRAWILAMAATMAAVTSAQYGTYRPLVWNGLAEPDHVEIADFDLDGLPDIGLSNGLALHQTAYLRNLGALGFSDPVMISSHCGSPSLFIDLNNDGATDAVATPNSGEPTQFFINDGHGHFSAEGTLDGSGLVPADLDQDGDQDILMQYTSERLAANDGYGNFSIQDLDYYVFGLVAVGDLNGDQWMDLAFMDHSSLNKGLYMMPGTGPLSYDTPIQLCSMLESEQNALSDMTVFDFDADGLQDIIAGEWAGGLWIMHNNGGGQFSLTSNPQFYPYVNQKIRLADADADGDMDLFSYDLDSLSVYLHENLGGGQWGTTQPIIRDIIVEDLAFADMDGDGRIEIVLAGIPKLHTSYMGSFLGPQSVYMAHGDSPLTWSVPQRLSRNLGLMRPDRTYVKDMDNDGDEDLVSVTDVGLVWNEQDSALQFSDAQVISQTPDLSYNGWWTAPSFGDLNGDGLEDMVFYESSTDSLRIVLNQQSGGLAQAISHNIYIFGLRRTELADADLDGDLDLMCLNLGYWMPNDGEGNFGAPHSYSAQLYDPGVLYCVRDLDLDGDSDIVYSYTDHHGWLENNGTGSYAGYEILYDLPVNQFECLDINHDDTLDLVGVFGGALICYRGKANTYSEYGLYNPAPNAPFKLLDYDGDGNVDALFENGQWLRGNGLCYGWSLEGYLPWAATSFRGVAAATDIDHDGDIDILLRKRDAQRTEYGLIENYGLSAFTISGRVYNDLNADGQFDANDEGLGYAPITTSPSTVAAFPGPDGTFTFHLDQASYTLDPGLDPQLWSLTTDSSSYHVTLTHDQPIRSGIDFGAHALMDTTLVAVSYTSEPAVCHSDAMGWISLRNLGTVTTAGTLTLEWDTMLFVGGPLPPPDLIQPGHAEWTIDTLRPFELREITVITERPSATYTGDTLHVSVHFATHDTLDQPTGTFSYQEEERISCSYDPNGKEVEPRGYGPRGGIDVGTPWLDYTVHFQNTGTAPAQNVVLQDRLPPELDPSSVILMGASHPLTSMDISNAGDMLIRFMGIALPPNNAQNTLTSCGFVRFRARLRAGLPAGTTIRNSAAILFDLNAPVLTDTTLNTLRDCSEHEAVVAPLGLLGLTANTGALYQWYVDGALIPGDTARTIAMEVNGEYTVNVVSDLGCSAMSQPFGFYSIGYANVRHEDKVMVYPDPVEDLAHVITTEPLSATDRLALIDVNGRVVSTFSGNGSTEQHVGRQGIASGLYSLIVHHGLEQWVVRIMLR